MLRRPLCRLRRHFHTARIVKQYEPGITATGQEWPINPATLEPRSLNLPRNPKEFGKYQSRAYQVVDESIAKSDQNLVTLHARLKLPKSITYSILSQTLNGITPPLWKEEEEGQDKKVGTGLQNHFGLARFGSSILDMFSCEYLMCQYPRLPKVVLESATNSYIGTSALADLGKNWGVERGNGPVYYDKPSTYSEIGKLRFPGIVQHRLPNLNVLSDGAVAKKMGNNNQQVKQQGFDMAMADFVRALIASIYMCEGIEGAKNFIYNHIFSRKIDISSTFIFRHAPRELSRLCARQGFLPPISRLLAETGRHSTNPIYIIGVYSGRDKIGEGTGASLREGKIRASIHAMKSWYLYQPNQSTLPTDTLINHDFVYKPNLISSGSVVV